MLGFGIWLASAVVQPLAAGPDAPAATAEEEMKQRIAAQPQAVRDFAERWEMCEHWAGEEPYDEARRREIDEALRDLRCETLSGEALFLRRYFARLAGTAALLDEIRAQSSW